MSNQPSELAEKIPGDRLVVAIEASTDRLLAHSDRMMWRMILGSALIAALGVAVFTVVNIL